MTWDLDLNGKTVLEPSAGMGDIVDFCAGSGATVLACEIVPELRDILKQKPCTIIADDFIEVRREDISHVNYIIMNPPFSEDDKHILHAFETAPEGCTIVSLCNWETLDNKWTYSRRKLAQIISNYGTQSNLGQVFASAERSTNVTVGMVRLHKPIVSEDADFSEYFSMEADDVELQENGIIRHSYVREIVQRYVASIHQYDKMLNECIQLNKMISAVAPYGFREITIDVSQDKRASTKETFIKNLQKSSWKAVFKKLELEKYVTVKVQEDINKMIETQTKIPFTMRNISLAVNAIIQNVGHYMDRSLLEIFDNLTMHHHDNRWNVEGWKTNSHYLVNEKFIKNSVMSTSSWDGFSLNRYTEDLLEDFCKGLCYITGQNYSNVPDLRKTVHAHGQYGTWFDWHFFEVKVYKKGTGHFKFKDRDVWATFNQNIARIKGYPLPEAIKTKNKN